jgi:ribosomal protein S18 acetylase RimI-like enzyme
MTSSVLVTRTAQTEHLSEVAEIHYRSLPDDFLPSLGLDFLERVYYPTAFQSSYATTLVALVDGHPIGFVTVAHDANRFYRDILCRRLFLIVVYALRAALRDLRHLRKTLEVFWSSVAGRPDPIKGEIVFIAVDESHRGRGAGKKLVIAALDYLRQKDVCFCRTKTLAQNVDVIKMYEGMGWRVHDSFRLIGREYVTIAVELAGDNQVAYGKDKTLPTI